VERLPAGPSWLMAWRWQVCLPWCPLPGALAWEARTRRQPGSILPGGPAPGRRIVAGRVACPAPGPAVAFSPVDATVAWAAVGAVGSVAAAGVAAWAAWLSRSSAQEANAAAGTMAAIERDRRHDELCPGFEITCTVRDTALTSADLHIVLKPSDLGRLDEVVVTILDERGADHWAHGLPDGVTQAEAEAFVWGGWEFNTGASEQVVSNRTTKPRSYSLADGKNWDVLSLRHTQPGQWMTWASPEEWQRQYRDKPVRLLLTCRREGYTPWTVLHEVRAYMG
jgi:hypothetical protein